ncbi:MAG TPA: hypothetical protein VMY37_32850 [Thermoguttaceae bacterium]|nr:hypothetical protein [Thermoguttaceae bacterium]
MSELPSAPPRRPLVVKPIFTYPLPTRRPQTSWRNWGGIQSRADVDQEAARIRGELDQLQAAADFPITLLPLAVIRRPDELAALGDLATADALLVWAGGDGGGNLMANMNTIAGLGKDAIFFVRHQSGPLYYWYEGIMARLLHQHTDTLALDGIDYEDVVVDRVDEVLWRLRALCGLRNTRGSGIIAVGGPGGWCQPRGVTAELVRNRWGLDIQTVSYEALGERIKAAREDKAAVALAHGRAGEYLKLPNTTMETDQRFVQNAFLLEQVFRALMHEAGCRAITVRGCMGTIMPIAETTACLPLSTLNDDGYLAFCESDFVVIPAGILLASISGRPPFLNDPTYPHDGVITLAHCTAPRKMDGHALEPARIMTHFESDYGAAPKVEMRCGQKVTNVIPDFAAERWVGLAAQIEAHPLMPICRSQIDVKFPADSRLLAERMPGFHWMTVYGDYLRETGYALKKIPIAWECLG